MQYEPPDENHVKKSDNHSLLVNGNGVENNHHKKRPKSAQTSTAQIGSNNHAKKASKRNRGAGEDPMPRGGKKAKKEKMTTIEQFNARRRKLWAAIMKKEISKGKFLSKVKFTLLMGITTEFSRQKLGTEFLEMAHFKGSEI